MPVVYHGTSRAFALAMAGTPPNGTIDVTRGRGEFGRGFYTQDSIGNAARRGYLIYGSNGSLLTLEIDDHHYHALNIERLTLNRAQKLNAQLRASGTQDLYMTKDDVIVGPLVNQPKFEQQKFQTGAAQTLLNGPRTRRIVRP